MPLLDLQRRIQEAGRIRIGQQVETKGGKTRPEKLETFRLTSADKVRIDQAAALFGGSPQQWDAPAGRQWEVVTTSDSLDVIVPPTDMAFSQWYETWSAGGCQRRCDGQHETISDGACLCDPDRRDCAIHTRLSVMLADLPGLGVWRIDTSGYFAAVELSGAVQVVQSAAGRGVMLPARLRLEQRTVKRPGQDGKPQTRRFAVPVLDVEITPAQLIGGQQMGEIEQVEQRTPEPRRLTPVPDDLPTGPQQSIAEQTGPPAQRRPGRNAAPEIPASGRRRNLAKPQEPSEEQRAKMFALLGNLGLGDDRDKYLALATWHVKRELGSTSEMSRDEVTGFIDYLEQRISGQDATARDAEAHEPATDEWPDTTEPGGQQP